MDLKELALLAIEETNDVILLTDLESHALLYVNKAGLRQFEISQDEGYLGQPCYRVLRGLDDVCPNCPLGLLTHDKFYDWEYHNPKVDRQFAARGKLIQVEDRPVHIELAYDVTELRATNLELQQRLDKEETLVACIQVLALNTNLNTALNNLLTIVGGYYRAQRAYIFELNRGLSVMEYTYEWCAPGVLPQQPIFKQIPLSFLPYWVEQFKETGELMLKSLDQLPRGSEFIRQVLDQNLVTSVIAAPLMLDGQMIGFCGVDSPEKYYLGADLLRSVAVFMAADLGKRRLKSQLNTLTYGDSLTNTGNRWAFLAALQTLRDEMPNTLGMIFCDVNGLKLANGSKGHEYGDYLLRHVGETLSALFERGVYRVGGDEFTVTCPNIPREEFEGQVSLLLEIVRRDADLPISVGSVWREGSEIDVVQMADMSDEAIRADKQNYYRARSQGSGDYLDALTQNLLQDLNRGDFCVFVQPKVGIQTGKLLGAEALIRRRDSKGGLIPPVRFIPLYEAEGIVRYLDFFVLETICTAMRAWIDAGAQFPAISINCSRVTASEEGIANKLLSICQGHGIEPQHIMVEITERIGSLAQEELTTLIQSLTQVGFRVSLDDFGAEYSNLALLSSVGFDEIKLDKSLVDHLECNSSSRIVVDHVIAMCRELGNTSIVAEGIETEAQRELLDQLQCECGQGYLFSKPVPLEEFVEKYIFTSGQLGGKMVE